MRGLYLLMVLSACGAEAGRRGPGRDAAAPAGTPALPLPKADLQAPGFPGPAPRRRSFDAVAMNQRCERCHRDVALEWRASLHRRAHTDATYQHQLAREPFPFCRACHEPEADPAGEIPAALGATGPRPRACWS